MRLRPVARVDVDVFLGEIAGPDARGSADVMQIDDNRNVFLLQAAMRDAFVERKGYRIGLALRRAVHFYSTEPDFGVVGIERHAGAARGGKDAPPVWIGAGKRRLH